MKELIAIAALLVATTAYAACTMTTVIDPNTGLVKVCSLCCENGMCTTICN